MRLRGLPSGAAQQGLDAHQQDVQVEGLGQVVVGAGFDALKDVLGTRARGQHQDRSVVLGIAQGARDREAVGAGEHAVEDDDADLFRTTIGGGQQIGKSGIAVGLMVGAEALCLEVEQQTLGEVFFVFDDGDKGGLMRVCHVYNCPANQCIFAAGWRTLSSRGTKPFHAIWTPMQSRMKAMMRRIPCAVDGEMCRAMRCECA